MPTQRPQWDAHQIINTVNADTGTFTCLGFAKTQRRRCRNPIRQDKRAEALRIIDRLAHERPSATAIQAELKQIAVLCCCTRWHSADAPIVADKWLQKIRIEYPEYEGVQQSNSNVANQVIRERNTRTVRILDNDRPQPRSQPSHLPSDSLTDISQQIEALSSQLGALLVRVDSFQAESEGQVQRGDRLPYSTRDRVNQWLPAISRSSTINTTSSAQQITPSTTSGGQGSRRYRASSDREGTPSPHSRVATSAGTMSREETSSNTSTSSRRTPPLTTRSFNSMYDVSVPSVSSVDPDQVHLSSSQASTASRPSPSAHNRKHVHRRPVQGACAICLDDMENEPSDNIAWCRRSCGQNFHAECVNEWHASQIDAAGWESSNRMDVGSTNRNAVEVALTCPLCRQDWLLCQPPSQSSAEQS